jgi:hypothetical protein
MSGIWDHSVGISTWGYLKEDTQVDASTIYGSKVDEHQTEFLASIDKYAPKTTYDDVLAST